MADFHFIRPLWLLLIPFAFALSWWWRGQRVTHGGWSAFVDAHLLQAQFSIVGGRRSRWLRQSAPLAAAVALLAAAGPSWEQEKSSVMRQQVGRVFLLDISQSMNAADLKPSRLSLGRLKLLDLLQASRDRQVALAVFAAYPYVVSPMTDDALTLRETVAALTTELAPSQGADTAAAIEYAYQLLRQAGLTQGEIVLLTDSAADAEALKAAKQVAAEGLSVSVLAIGTEAGAPVPGRNSGALLAANGRPLIVGLPIDSLRQLATAGSGRFSLLSADSTDIDTILPVSGPIDLDALEDRNQSTERWLDRGPWLLWLLLPWGLWAFSTRWF